MAKAAQRYLKCEPWCVVETGFHPERNKTSESVFALANEQMGVRGYPEEGTDAPSMLGSYFGGVYELQTVQGQPGYKGVVHQTHYMACAADFLFVRLWQMGQPLVLRDDVQAFERVLELQSGLHTRSYLRPLPAGGMLSLRFERLLGMENADLACQRLTLGADVETTLTVEMGVDGTVKHQTTGECLWQAAGLHVGDKRGCLRMKTTTTAQTVDYAFLLDASCEAVPVAEGKALFFRMTVHLKPGEPVTLTRRIKNTVNADAMPDMAALDDLPSFQELLGSNQAHYQQFWRTADVEIEGDDLNQQGIRYCLFQMHQTYRGLDGCHNIGAKGLTGEVYNGHAFWDSETYCLPYYLLNDPKAAHSLLMFRYHTLPQARLRAKELDCEGACYPIATLDGTEACTLWQHASLQMQPSTAVAYAIMQYALFTGDTAFLCHEGLEMLVDICRYIYSRGNWNADHTGFGFYGVMGPDEFHMMVNNNFYTNFMAKKTLEATLRVLENAPVADASQEERQRWREAADKMILLRRADGVFEQHEGYFGLPHLDVHQIPEAQFPLYEHWSYDRIYRTDMIKQPDVLMAMFLYPDDFTAEEKAANFAFYEPHCIHESSLSPSIHAIIAQELNMDALACRFFGFATRMDLDDYNRNTCDGLHLTSIAAAWITIVYGFGGLRISGSELRLAPRLPDGWKRFAFHLQKGTSVVRVEVSTEGCRLYQVRGEPIELTVNGVPQMPLSHKA